MFIILGTGGDRNPRIATSLSLTALAFSVG